jgi:hypothetical protein
MHKYSQDCQAEILAPGAVVEKLPCPGGGGFALHCRE